MVSDATLSAAQSYIQPKSLQQNQQQPGVANNRSQLDETDNSQQARQAPVTESQDTETRNNGQQDNPALRVADENSSSVQFTGSEERGSVIDITV